MATSPTAIRMKLTLSFGMSLKRRWKRGGKVVVPSFAVGRTQELVYDLNRMMSDGEIPEYPGLC